MTTEVWADTSLAQRQDIAIRFGDGNWQGCKTELIYNEGVVPVCSPAFKQANSLPLAELPDQQLIHVHWGEELWQRYLEGDEPHSKLRQKHISVDTSLAALELAAGGVGCALILRRFAETMLASGQLVLAEDRELSVPQSHYFVDSGPNENSRREVSEFRNWLIGELKSTN